MPGASAAHPDDFAGHDYWHDSDGAETGHGRGTIHADGSRHHRGVDFLGGIDHLHRPSRIFAGLRQARREERRESGTGGSGMKIVLPLLLALFVPAYSVAQGSLLSATSTSLPSAPLQQQSPPAVTSVPMAG